jgi:hypothetical protein
MKRLILAVALALTVIGGGVTIAALSAAPVMATCEGGNC